MVRGTSNRVVNLKKATKLVSITFKNASWVKDVIPTDESILGLTPTVPDIPVERSNHCDLYTQCCSHLDPKASWDTYWTSSVTLVETNIHHCPEIHTIPKILVNYLVNNNAKLKADKSLFQCKDSMHHMWNIFLFIASFYAYIKNNQDIIPHHTSGTIFSETVDLGKIILWCTQDQHGSCQRQTFIC